MPQMAPLWWTTLYLYFTFTFILVSMLVFFYLMKYPIISSHLQKFNFKFNWLW
uniref:ATP synthase F0 subunit 8 n=1 Tax=Ornebius fuscicerci TaxID=2153492 RepID=A0A385I207_9ORTH|nr:ATP synthase F0 subunit 8 [Ornebius fuscicerci]AXY63940.1 ATP synthase F0 subunit 8 [Ornebius fuscicerci]